MNKRIVFVDDPDSDECLSWEEEDAIVEANGGDWSVFSYYNDDPPAGKWDFDEEDERED